MNKYFCDHCNKEINDFDDYIDTQIETINAYYRVDLCAKCRDDLLKMQNEMVKEFCNIKS